jgi:hypothetical protein
MQLQLNQVGQSAFSPCAETTNPSLLAVSNSFGVAVMATKHGTISSPPSLANYRAGLVCKSTALLRQDLLDKIHFTPDTTVALPNDDMAVRLALSRDEHFVVVATAANCLYVFSLAALVARTSVVRSFNLIPFYCCDRIPCGPWTWIRTLRLSNSCRTARDPFSS